MSLKKNVIANYIGQAWTSLISFIFVPVYIKYLGIESYGLIGFFTMLYAWLSLLDMGMTPTLSREMARYTAGVHDNQSILDLLRTIEYLYFSMSLLLGIAIWLSSDWLANYWLQTRELPVDTLITAISIMGMVISLRFIEGLYRGAIIGLQQQVWLNIVNATLATIRSVGAVFVLILIEPSIELFFLWQAIVSFISILIFIIVTYKYLPCSQKPAKFCINQLKKIWQFSSNMMIITLLSLILTQIDKIVLSRLLSLEMFGYYTLASIIANILTQFVTPITQAYYPHLVELVINNNNIELVETYHQSSHLVSVIVIPATLILFFCSANILLLWTHSSIVSINVQPLLEVLALGMMLNSFMHMPFLLTLAYGWTKFAICQDIIAVVLLIPLIIFASSQYGAIGAAFMWMLLNMCYVLISVHFLYRQLLSKEKWRWYICDIIFPMLASLLIGFFCQLVQPTIERELVWLSWLLITGALMVLGAWFSKYLSSLIMGEFVTIKIE